MRTTLLLCAHILAFAMLVAYQMLTYFHHKRISSDESPTDGPHHRRQHHRTLLRAGGTHQGGRQDPMFLVYYLNVEKFRLLNRDSVADVDKNAALRLHDGITSDLSPHECMGRLLPTTAFWPSTLNEEQILKPLRHGMGPPGVCRTPKAWLSPHCGFGVLVINNDSLPFPPPHDLTGQAGPQNPPPNSGAAAAPCV